MCGGVTRHLFPQVKIKGDRRVPQGYIQQNGEGIVWEGEISWAGWGGAGRKRNNFSRHASTLVRTLDS